MTRYIIKRCIMIIPIVLGVIFCVFVMLYHLPGSSISRMPIYAYGDRLDFIFRSFDTGSSIWAQYLRYCYNVFIHFDFGLSRAFNVSNRVKLTLILMSLGVAFALIIGVLSGIYTAIYHNKWQDHVIMFLTLLFSSIPSYCIALILCIIFVRILNVLPLFGIDSPAHFILPTLTLSAGGIAMVTRTTRASFLGVLSQNFIIALHARGLKEQTVIYLHALKNALVPVASLLGTLTAQLLFNSFVAEYFFSIHGIGSLLLESVGSRNHLAVLCSSVILAMILSIIFLFTDLLYTLINPNLKLQYTKGSRR